MASVVAWMAPERLQGQTTGDDDDEKCDVYSFGMTLWEIMTGRVPWNDLSEDQMKAKIANGERPDAGDISGFNALVDVMESCLNKDPESRPMFTNIIHLISPHRKSSLELELERENSQEQERLFESRIAQEVSRLKEILENEFQAKLLLKEGNKMPLS